MIHVLAASNFKLIQSELPLNPKSNTNPNANSNDNPIGNSLFSLKEKTSDSLEVRNLVKELALKFKDSTKEVLNAGEISNALYGLNGLSCDYPEVRAIVSLLVPKVESSDYNFKVQAMVKALYGLRSMNSNSSG